MKYRHFYKTGLLATLFVVAASDHAMAAGKVGDMLNNITTSSAGFSNLMSMVAYIAGSFLAVAGVFKFKDHIEQPHQHPVSAGVKRFLAGGMFLSLPFMAGAMRHALFGGDTTVAGTTHVGAATGGAGSMDTMIVDLMGNIYGPAMGLLQAFAYLSGIGLLLVGISRLTKRMEEGPRGPAGMGTIMTFIVSGALFSFGSSASAFLESVFGSGQNKSLFSATLSTNLIDSTSAAQITPVIGAVMGFVTLVGYIAFMRGWFVLRSFADGQQGATLAQGLTFLFGGALAINLGGLVNMLEATLGISGIMFN